MKTTLSILFLVGTILSPANTDLIDAQIEEKIILLEVENVILHLEIDEIKAKNAELEKTIEEKLWE